MTQGPLCESDIEELTEICKAAHGLAEKRSSAPLDKKHIPVRDTALNVVTLTSITHHAGVNGLAPEQMIGFGPGLTIVYGDNAAGKSGYTRVLKRACRARGAEEILGNVLSGSAPGRPSATIQFKVGDREEPLAWNDQEVAQHPLGNVSVFDSHCAAVYLTEKTDVAFRPFALDLFDKLSDACESLRVALEKERAALETIANLPALPEGTAAHDLVSHITSLTKPDDVRKLATLSEEEKGRLKQLRDRIKDLKSDDPQKTARTLNLRAQRLDVLVSHLRKLERALGTLTVSALFDARDAVENAHNAAQAIRSTAFPPELLSGTGSDLWRALWEAARRFSTAEAYPQEHFPVTGEEARCLLCQQDLRTGSPDRLRCFEEFIQSTFQQELDRARSKYGSLLLTIENLLVSDEATDRTIEDLRLDAEELATSVERNLRNAHERRGLTLRSLKEGRPLPAELPHFDLDSDAVATHAQTLRDRATQVLEGVKEEVEKTLSKEIDGLAARETLANNVDVVLNEIERKKKLAAYQLCLQDTSTRGITQKSSDVTKATVTKRLASSFQEELGRLRFTHLEVELREAGGARGALYHKLVLKRAAGVELPRVVSEGEARTLSIAAFFAELSTSSDRCAILFDDPVSSLDHIWRENVARRLAEEAKTRQVIVFTHDIAFLVALVTCAEEIGAQCYHQYLRREVFGAGMSSQGIPWVAMKVKERIGVLKNNWQQG